MFIFAKISLLDSMIIPLNTILLYLFHVFKSDTFYSTFALPINQQMGRVCPYV